MGDESPGALESGVAVVDPDSYSRALVRVLGHKRYLGVFFFEVFVDNRGFVDDRFSVHQHGNFAVRIELEKVLGLIFEIALDQFVGKLFFGQDKPCPVRVGSRAVGKKFHQHHLARVLLFLVWRFQRLFILMPKKGLQMSP